MTVTSNDRPERPLARFEPKLHHEVERVALYHLSKITLANAFLKAKSTIF